MELMDLAKAKKDNPGDLDSLILRWTTLSKDDLGDVYITLE